MNSEDIKNRQEQILNLSLEFCAQHLGQGYTELVKKLHGKLCRKRAKPLKTGKVEIWAVAIIHALGTINFLFDRSAQPYVSVKQLNEWFGAKSQTTSSKSALIRDMFDLHYFHPEFSLDALQKDNPMNELVMVDDLWVPVSQLNSELQEMVRKARSEGKDIYFTSE